MNIAVISLGFLGDTLMVGPLCANIRKNFPDSKIIYIVNKVFEDVPKGFKSVDEIFPFDKTGKHKGLWGYIKFAKEFPYRNNIDYCIITHEHERSLIAAKVIGAKKIISKPVKNSPLNIFINMKRPIIQSEIENTYKADYFTDFLQPICTPEHFPVCYSRKEIDDKLILDKFDLPKKYIVLSPTTKDLVKDWDFEYVKKFIENSPLPVVLVGTDKAFESAKKLDCNGVEYINLTKQTTISELGVVIKHGQVCVSCDTGTFHFSYSQGVKTIGIFFNKDFIKMWAPKNLKNVTILTGEKILQNGRVECIKNIEADEVISKVKELLSEDIRNLLK